MSKNPFQKFVVRFTSGERVFEEGDPGATMFIVQSGRVRLFRAPDGQEHDLGVMEKGDFFGEMSILEGLPRTHCAEALDDVELIEINNTTFDKMIKSNIEIAIRMLRKLSIRLREAERRVGDHADNGAVSPSPSTSSAAASTQIPSSMVTGARLEAEEGGGVYPLHGGEVLIGRYDPVTEMKPDVDLTEVDLKRSVSRRHARILQTDQGYVLIEEVGALNGTFVNGTKLVAGEAQPIRDGDLLGMGMVKLLFQT